MRAIQRMVVMARLRRLCHLRQIRNISATTSCHKDVPSVSSAAHNAQVLVQDALQYERKDPVQHILLRPDTYIGSPTMAENVPMWVFNTSENRMERVSLNYSPGLLKIFDEILVNAADNKARSQDMTEIRVEIDKDSGWISVRNNGRGLPIVLHPVEGVFVPSLVFGSLFTSSNYDDSHIKTVGGRNGFGAKLCNIFSEEFCVESASKVDSLHFSQTWRNNMQLTDGPVVSNRLENDDFTAIRFKPDYKKFGMIGMDDAIFRLFTKRTIDIAGTLPGIDVFFNGCKVKVDSFIEFAKRHVAEEQILWLNLSSRWKIVIAPSVERYFEQVSFVNNIATTKGGSHVDHVVEQAVEVIKGLVTKQIGKNVSIRSQVIKSYLFVFVNAVVENPSFDSQTKDSLTTAVKNFTVKAEIPTDRVALWADQTGIVSSIVKEIERKKAIQSVSSKKNLVGLSDIPKLEDAAWAGTQRASQCTLVLTEGDSAKSLAVAGLEVIGRDRYGVFPIKGKLVNVSGMTKHEALKNVEISNLVRILGLKFGLDYSTEDERSTLRYGRVIIFADQDEDGSHIKGLLLHFFFLFWPQLGVDGFVCAFNTPLLKARHGSDVTAFYSMADYRNWLAANENSKKYTVKYYKGLGTSTAAEAREYFRSMDDQLVRFRCDSGDAERLKDCFDKGRAEERKRWIEHRNEVATTVDERRTQGDMAISSFIDHELFAFSLLDLKRSIPSLVDGLKPSQRKILHTLLSAADGGVKEIKVNQLAAAVSLKQFYHHGEDSLVASIIRMSQSFCGSNNVPLLKGVGQFGTRHEGGQDAASARYIFVSISPLTRYLFPHADDVVLRPIVEEGHTVEPEWYCPIVPIVLVNGCEGIGTGWCTRLLAHSLTQVTENVYRLIDGDTSKQLIPFYEGFNGNIEPLESGNRFQTRGIIQALDKQRTNSRDLAFSISELPVGVWTNRYKENVLHPMIKQGIVRSIREEHTERGVRFIVSVPRSTWRNLVGDRLLRKFRLSNVISSSPIMLFDGSGHLRSFKSPTDVMSAHFEIRKELYQKRLDHSKKRLAAERLKLEMQHRFVESFVNGSVRLNNKNEEELKSDLENMGFVKDPVAASKGTVSSFDYLLNTPVFRLTDSERNRLNVKLERKREEETHMRLATWQDLWVNELDLLLEMTDERTMYVGNLASDVTKDLLEELFTQSGPLERVNVVDKGHKFALVTFEDEESVPFALETMDGLKLFNTAISCKPRNGTQQEERWLKKNRRPERNSYMPVGMDDRKRDHEGRSNTTKARQAHIPSSPGAYNYMSPLPPPPPLPMMMGGRGMFTPPGNRPQPGFKLPSSCPRPIQPPYDSWHTPPHMESHHQHRSMSTERIRSSGGSFPNKDRRDDYYESPRRDREDRSYGDGHGGGRRQDRYSGVPDSRRRY